MCGRAAREKPGGGVCVCVVVFKVTKIWSTRFNLTYFQPSEMVKADTRLLTRQGRTAGCGARGSPMGQRRSRPRWGVTSPKGREAAVVWRAAFGCSDPAPGLPEATSPLSLATALLAAGQAQAALCKPRVVTCSSRHNPLSPPTRRHASPSPPRIYTLLVWLEACFALAFSHTLWRSEPCFELGLEGEKLY